MIRYLKRLILRWQIRFDDFLREAAIRDVQNELDSLDRPTSHDGWVYARAVALKVELANLKRLRSPQQHARMRQKAHEA